MDVEVVLRPIEHLAVYVVDSAVPLSGLHERLEFPMLVALNRIREPIEEHPVDLHPFRPYLLFLDRRDLILTEVVVDESYARIIARAALDVALERYARQYDLLVVVELGLEVVAVAEEVEELEGRLLGRGDGVCARLVEDVDREVVGAGSSPLDLDEVGGREDGAEQADVQDVGAVVPCGHHADGNADARLGGAVGWVDGGGSQEVVVGELHRHLLRVLHLRGDLHCKIRLVHARKHAVCDLIEDLRKASGVLLADRKDDGLADFAADGIPQGVL